MRALKSETGFTLVEVMIGIMIFLVAIIGVAIVFANGGENVLLSRAGEKARSVAEDTVDEARREPFHVSYAGANADIDDFYYNASKTNAQQLDNPGYTKDFGVSPNPDQKVTVAAQYQKVNSVTGQLVDPVPTMAESWGPKAVGNDAPVDSTGERLRLILVRVKVWYRAGARAPVSPVQMNELISDNEGTGGPRIDSVSPNGAEPGCGFSFEVFGDEFDSPTVRLTKAGYPDDVGCARDSWNVGVIKCHVTATMPDPMHTGSQNIYWDVQVINADSMITTSERAIYEITQPPQIFSLSPSSGAAGSWVKITGRNFGVKGANDFVNFDTGDYTFLTDYDKDGNGEIDSYEWCNNYIWFKVNGAVPDGVKNVFVRKKTHGDGNAVQFTVGKYIEHITNIEAGKAGASGNVGDTIRIYGSGFGSTQGAGYVGFPGAVQNTCAIWSDGMIECDVPNGVTNPSNPGNVYVHKSTQSNNVSFWVPYAAGH
ncbi:MAG: hypothetical protein CVT63_02730 [Candidatus Anoxymicrobium japonicum]|uniref:Uncharacterized protein n=1 Tax=Candidatus Anoxymicrobium japonicum TaxID=2013648 RepID=A0A2N3G739_9ACTN|nr:MAG: hypothetical protein CVT63_02730 [Candidatus Anoxymicrobium japonicum]